jgi:ABC-2 type transport system permease protein
MILAKMIGLIGNPIGVAALSKREILRFLSLASQTIFPALLSAALFMYIFGVAIGQRLNFNSSDFSYLTFIVPGLMTMHLISSAYENTSSSLFIARWHNHIQEVLLSPLSYFEMVLGLLAGGVMRGTLVAAGVFLVSLLFTVTPIAHPLLLLIFILLIAVIFSCAGMLGALWAEDFSMLNLWNIYLIVPTVFLGGVFHPLSILPKPLQTLTVFNPMFYLVNGMRYSITGAADVSVWVCLIFTAGMALAIFGFTVHLFKIGYKLRT